MRPESSTTPQQPQQDSRRARDSHWLGGIATALVWLACAHAGALHAAEDAPIAIPEGVLPFEVPADNPITKAKIELGRELYFDKRLSVNDSVACATCHDPRTGFADGRGARTSAGVGGALGPRNSPTTLNSAFLSTQFWDGRAPTLEAQAIQPLINPIEMGFPDHAAVVAKLRAIPAYAPKFKAAFGDDALGIEQVGKAIASFERTLVSLSAPIDRFLAGDAKAIPEPAKRGWELYNGKARCNTCHGHVSAFPLFTDDLFHNIGVGAKRPDFESTARAALADAKALETGDALAVKELGRFAVTRQAADLGRFKTPHLRNIALTAPYMHDGSEATLVDVIEYYDRGGNANPWIDGGMRTLQLTAQEKSDLVELLQTFTSDDLERFESLRQQAR